MTLIAHNGTGRITDTFRVTPEWYYSTSVWYLAIPWLHVTPEEYDL